MSSDAPASLPEPIRRAATLDDPPLPAHPLKVSAPEPVPLPAHGLTLGPVDATVILGGVRWRRGLAVRVLVALLLGWVAVSAGQLALAWAGVLLLALSLVPLRRHLTRVSGAGVRGVPAKRVVPLEGMYQLRLKAAWEPSDPAPDPRTVDGVEVSVRVGTFDGKPVLTSVDLDLSDETAAMRLRALGVVRGWVLVRPELAADNRYTRWCLGLPGSDADHAWFEPMMRATVMVRWDTVPEFVPHTGPPRRHVPRAGPAEWPEPTEDFRADTTRRLAATLNSFSTVNWVIEEFRSDRHHLDLDVLNLTVPWASAPPTRIGWPDDVVEVVTLRTWPRHIQVSLLRSAHPKLSALTDRVLDALQPVLGPAIAEPRGPHWATHIHRRRRQDE